MKNSNVINIIIVMLKICLIDKKDFHSNLYIKIYREFNFFHFITKNKIAIFFSYFNDVM